MSVTISGKQQQAFSSELIKGGIERILREKGRLPPVTMIITPIESSRPVVKLENFIDYSFDSSILIPVDSFSFKFANPDGKPFYDEVKEGDLVTLYANDVPLATGILDTIEIDTETESGEMVSVSGRDLLSQFEDQDAISVNDAPLFGGQEVYKSVFDKLAPNTRLSEKGLILKDVPPVKSGLFATTPGESKLTALQRFLEPLNVLAWMNPNGKLIIGKPSFSQAPSGILKMNKTTRDSNCTSMKVIYAAANIPSEILPIWSGQESVQNRIASQKINNAAFGPTRLRKAGHRLAKSVVASTPVGSGAQALSDVNFFTQNTNVLLAMANREMARLNKNERIVQVVVPSHYNESGEPYIPDTVYRIQYERGSLDSEMYLFQVQYSLSESMGQKTTLFFCNKNTIVAGNKQ